MKSLVSIHSPHTGGVYIYVDDNDKLTPEQLAQIHACSPQAEICCSARVTGYGRSTINTELQCLRAVAEAVHPEAYLAKTDSDIIFVSGRIFRSVVNSHADILGEAVRHFDPYFYTSGGCYFVKANIACGFSEIDEQFCADVLARVNNDDARRRGVEVQGSPGEDAAIFHLVVDRMGKRACFLDGYRSSILHFSENKNNMFRYDRRLSFQLKYKYLPLFRSLVGRGIRIVWGERSAKH